MGSDSPPIDTPRDDDKYSDFSETVESSGFAPEVQRLYDFLTANVIGQHRAHKKIARGHAVHLAGLNAAGKPIGIYLFAGPTGWGKTETINQLGWFLIGGDQDADGAQPPVTLIECTSYMEKHEASKIIGAPPGYVGYSDPPRLAQLKIDEPHFRIKTAPLLAAAFKKAGPKADPDAVLEELYEANKPYYSVVGLDEFEKAHSSIHDASLHFLEGKLTTGDGQTTDFSHTTFILTCNINGQGQQDLIAGRTKSMRFRDHTERKSFDEMSEAEREDLDQKIYKSTKEVLRKFFKPEFVGRLSTNMVVFRALPRAQQQIILERMLNKLRVRFTPGHNVRSANTLPILNLDFTERYKSKVLDEGVEIELGIRNLAAAVQQYSLMPLSNAILLGNLKDGDDVVLDYADGEVLVRRRPRSSSKIVLVGGGDK